MGEKIAICIPSREQARYTNFWTCVSRLERPENSLLYVNCNNSVAQARNEMTAQGLEAGCDAFFYLDDDQLFGKDVLMKLLARPEDVIIGLTMLRCSADGQFRPIWSNRPMNREPNGKMAWWALEDMRVESNGLVKLTSGTGGGVLIRRRVFETVPAPWWQMGQYDPEAFWEDCYAYDQFRAAGFDIWGDPSVRFGHYQPTVLWPHQRPDGSWSTVIAHGFDGFIEQPWPTAKNALAMA
jgi:hypothetical protein